MPCSIEYLSCHEYSMWRFRVKMCACSMYVCMHVSMYVCVCVCMYTWMYVCVCMYVRMNVCVYVSTYVCVCVYVYENGCLQPKHVREISEMQSCDSSQPERVFTQSVLNSENSWHCCAMLRVVKRDWPHVRTVAGCAVFTRTSENQNVSRMFVLFVCGCTGYKQWPSCSWLCLLTKITFSFSVPGKLHRCWTLKMRFCLVK